MDPREIRHWSGHDGAPLAINDGVDLVEKGHFVVTIGDRSSKFGRVRSPAVDENGNRRQLSGSVTEVHKPLGSAAGIGQHRDTFLWDGGGCHHAAFWGRRAWDATGLPEALRGERRGRASAFVL